MSSSFIYCACDECIEYANKKYNSYPICDDCLEYDIYIENDKLTLTPVDLNNSKIFEFDETKFEIIKSEVDNSDTENRNYEEVAWLTGC